MTDTKHTPTPWEVLNAPFNDTNQFLWVAVKDQENANPIVQLFNYSERVTSVFDNAAANAFFIIKACNAYEDNQAKIKALTEALEMIAGKRQCPDNLMSNVDVALAALKKAGVE